MVSAAPSRTLDLPEPPAAAPCAPLQSLGTLRPGTSATIVTVGCATEGVTALELRLLELGFIAGERIEVVAEARPGRDPFVVRIGTTQFALRRREAGNVWVEDVAPSR